MRERASPCVDCSTKPEVLDPVRSCERCPERTLERAVSSTQRAQAIRSHHQTPFSTRGAPRDLQETRLATSCPAREGPSLRSPPTHCLSGLATHRAIRSQYHSGQTRRWASRNQRGGDGVREESNPAEGRHLAAERTHLAHSHIAKTQFANPPSGARFMTPRSRMREVCEMALIRYCERQRR